jgi:hypothetical protein
VDWKWRDLRDTGQPKAISIPLEVFLSLQRRPAYRFSNRELRFQLQQLLS